jgi:hypothetical protein
MAQQTVPDGGALPRCDFMRKKVLSHGIENPTINRRRQLGKVGTGSSNRRSNLHGHTASFYSPNFDVAAPHCEHS